MAGSTLLYSSKDVAEAATADLHELTRNLHAIQADRSTNARDFTMRKMFQLKSKRNDEESFDCRQEIQKSLHLAARSLHGGVASDIASALVEMEDNIKFDTRRTQRALQCLYRKIYDLDKEISKVQGTEGSVPRFAYIQKRKAIKINSLEMQINTITKKLSTMQSEVITLRAYLEDLNQANQFLHNRLELKAREQKQCKEAICKVFININQSTGEEKEAKVVLATLAASSEKLEMLCEREWAHIMKLVAEKTSLEDRVRRYRSEDELPKHIRNTRRTKTVAPVVHELVKGTETDAVCKIWAQCTWSNAIDLVKIRSATAWLKQRQNDWNRIVYETGLVVGDNDALGKWFSTSEQNNIALFEEARELAVARKQAMGEPIGHQRQPAQRRLSMIDALAVQMQICQNQMELTQVERQTAFWTLQEIKERLSNIILGDLSIANISTRSLTDMLEIVEEWTNSALVEQYGEAEEISTMLDAQDNELALVQVQPPAIALSDDEDEP